MTSTRKWPLAAIGITLLLAACSVPFAELFRRHTYPPPFHYVSRAEVRSTMWQLAGETWRLDGELRKDEPSRLAVLSALERMDALSRELGPGDVPSNHPVLTGNVDRLRDDIALAKRGAERDPPNWFYAGTVAGACLYCHGARR